jgi:hypothetical protein
MSVGRPTKRPSYRIVQRRSLWYAQRRYWLRWRIIGPFGSQDGFPDIQGAAYCASIYMKGDRQ